MQASLTVAGINFFFKLIIIIIIITFYSILHQQIANHFYWWITFNLCQRVRHIANIFIKSCIVWSASRPGRFTPGKDPVPIVQEAGWAPEPVWIGAENLASPGFEPRTFQHVASRYPGSTHTNTHTHTHTYIYIYIYPTHPFISKEVMPQKLEGSLTMN
jgi:hypothetical protein